MVTVFAGIVSVVLSAVAVVVLMTALVGGWRPQSRIIRALLGIVGVVMVIITAMLGLVAIREVWELLNR